MLDAILSGQIAPANLHAAAHITKTGEYAATRANPRSERRSLLIVLQDQLILPEWAAELGALIINIEHRLFGLSNPSNASDAATRYKSLTREKVMSDAVNLINSTKHTIAGAQNSKMVVLGGSYAGSLGVFWS